MAGVFYLYSTTSPSYEGTCQPTIYKHAKRMQNTRHRCSRARTTRAIFEFVEFPSLTNREFHEFLEFLDFLEFLGVLLRDFLGL